MIEWGLIIITAELTAEKEFDGYTIAKKIASGLGKCPGLIDVTEGCTALA